MKRLALIPLALFCFGCATKDTEEEEEDTDWGAPSDQSDAADPFGGSGSGTGGSTGSGSGGGPGGSSGSGTGGGSGGSSGGGTGDDGNPYTCGDTDGDGCDDCTIEGEPTPSNDGWDYDGDGQCEIALDPECLHGEMADTDPERETACILFALANMDRALFTDETDGAPPLEWNENVWKVAHGHAKDMCERDYYSHNTPEGLNPTDRAAALGFDFSLAENIHMSINPFNAHFDFMAEPTCVGHRSNVLHPIATEAGMAVHTCSNPGADSDGWMHVTENFIWDWSLPSPEYCGISANVCEVPEDPIRLAHEWCNTFPCTEVAAWSFDAYCPDGMSDAPPQWAPIPPPHMPTAGSPDDSINSIGWWVR